MSAPYRIELEYPLYPEPRYGWGRPPHPKLVQILERGRAVYREHLSGFLGHEPRLASVAKVTPDAEDTEPSWINGSLPGLDAVALYGMLSRYRPARYFEIGAGHSTKWAYRSIQDQSLSTTITAIDPFPKPYIQTLCNELVDQPLERVDLSLFDQLEANDILFVDNSHRVFMNSDATVVFLDILPRLKPGVLVEFHDIALPVDYPPQFADKYFSEQYVLAAYLLAEGRLFDVILPNAFCSLDKELSQVMSPLWRHPNLNGDRVFDLEQIARGDSEGQERLIETFGSSFWIRINDNG
jgi:hypothetical protein